MQLKRNQAELRENRMSAKSYLEGLKTDFVSLYTKNANGDLGMEDSNLYIDLKEKLARLLGETRFDKIFNLIVKNS